VAEDLANNDPPRNTNVFYDLSNEHNRAPDNCNGPSNLDLPPAQVLELANALHAGDPSAVLLTASTGGQVPNNSAHYRNILDNNSVTFLAPHFMRDDDGTWAENTAERIQAIRTTISPRSVPIHLQQPNRRSDGGTRRLL